MQLPFWSSDLFELNEGFALVTGDESITYYELNNMVNEYAAHLAEFDLKNQLAFLPMKMNIFSVVRYLACLRESIVPLLLPSHINESLIQKAPVVRADQSGGGDGHGQSDGDGDGGGDGDGNGNGDGDDDDDGGGGEGWAR